MLRFALPCWLVCAAGLARAEEEIPGPKEAEALQKAMQNAIQQGGAQPSPASSSRAATAIASSAMTPPENDSGKLGGFNALP